MGEPWSPDICDLVLGIQEYKFIDRIWKPGVAKAK